MFNKTIKAKDDDVAHAVNAALRILTCREHSILELYKKLILKFTDKASKEAIKKCIENNWQSQERYMQMLFEHLVNQCYGPRKIALEASKKGVKAQYYQEMMDSTDFVEVAVKFLAQKIDPSVDLSFEDKQKILASLARRGFSNSMCMEALNTYLSNLN